MRKLFRCAIASTTKEEQKMASYHYSSIPMMVVFSLYSACIHPSRQTAILFFSFVLLSFEYLLTIQFKMHITD
jgi:hypothetical protein